MQYVKALTLATSIGCIAACGQKGPLVLPDRHAPAPAAAKPAEPASAAQPPTAPQ